MNDKPTISLVVPHWPRVEGDDDMLQRCIKSIHADEKIVIVNAGTGMGKAINQGLRVSTGDYIIVSNNDCEWSAGDVYAMCDPEAITIPNNMNGQWDMPRAFYCMPRWVYELIGGYDEQFGVGYFEDDDLIRRWQFANIPFKMINSVQVKHDAGHTLNNLGERQRIFDENKAKFNKKWNESV